MRGAADLTLPVGSSIGDLYHARFECPQPRVRAECRAVTIEYPCTFHPFNWRKRAAEVTLNAQVPWEIGVRGGVSMLDADLTLPRSGAACNADG